MSSGTLRKGWCPGVLRPMPAGDGLLVRLRLSTGTMRGDVARQVARLSTQYGSGAIDLTQRANLQLRGVRADVLEMLVEELAAIGLIDPSIEAEAVRNVMVSPLAGIDALCLDGRDIARELESKLQGDRGLHKLPAKFGIVIDGGGRWPLGEVGADVALVADRPVRLWRIQLGGAGMLSEPVPDGRAAEAVLALAALFVNEARGHDALRMRDLVAVEGAGTVLGRIGLSAQGIADARPSSATPGVLDLPPLTVVTVGLPFGRIEGAALSRLCDVSSGIAFRLTPWRLLCAVCPNSDVAEKVMATARDHDLIVEAGDPRLGIDACIGSPGCTNASTQTRNDAARLATMLRGCPSGSGTIHVSGCLKGCAHRGAAPVTFIGRDGRYMCPYSWVCTAPG